MEAPVVLGSEGGTCVVLRDRRGPDSEGWSSYVVELHGAGLDAHVGVLTHSMSPLGEFVATLAS